MDNAIYRLAGFLGSPAGLLATLATVAVGVLIGVPLGFSDRWQLGFNLYLSIAALMVGAIILVAGKRSEMALQAKLDEVLRAIPQARNDLIGLEEKPEPEIEALRPTP